MNEERCLALFVLCDQFKSNQEAVFNYYLENLKWVNNWNLVDVSAHLIIGAYLFDKPRDLLLKLAISSNLWERRVAVVSTLYFIRKKDFDWTFKIVTMLLNDHEDLIHKASGWMLREIMRNGGEKELRSFLASYSHLMPRTALRYAIERFDEDERKYFLETSRRAKS